MWYTLSIIYDLKYTYFPIGRFFPAHNIIENEAYYSKWKNQQNGCDHEQLQEQLSENYFFVDRSLIVSYLCGFLFFKELVTS